MEDKEGSPQKRVTRVMQYSREKKSETENAETRPALELHLTIDELPVVFRYLNDRDLSSAMRVCSLWSDVAEKEKRKRLRSPHLLLMHMSEGASATDLTDMHIQPVLGLLFTNEGHKDNMTRAHSDNRTSRTFGYHCAQLPRACVVVTVMGYGSIWNDRRLEPIPTSTPMASCLYLPAIPGVKIENFSCNEKSPSMSCRKLIESLEQNDVSCLVLFFNRCSPPLSVLTSLFNLIKRNERAVIWGGSVDKLTVCEESGNGRTCGVPVELAGWYISDKDVSAWSVMFGHQCETEEQVERTLTSFKAKVNLRKYSVGFQFSSPDRSHVLFKERNVESGIFRRLFPAVPLVGAIGLGQFGRTSVAGVTSRSDLLLNYSSSVFMILSYG